MIKPQVLDPLRDLTEQIVGGFYPDYPGLGGHIPDVVFLPSELNGEKKALKISLLGSAPMPLSDS